MNTTEVKEPVERLGRTLAETLAVPLATAQQSERHAACLVAAGSRGVHRKAGWA